VTIGVVLVLGVAIGLVLAVILGLIFDEPNRKEGELS
jgi:hypothetical protein